MKGNELYHQWQQMAAANPYLVARKSMGLTQEQVADRIDVTPQYIRRHEQGTVNTPSGSLNELYGLYANQFYLWVDRMRNLVKPALVNLPSFEECRLDSWSVQHPFKFAMATTTYRICHYFDLSGMPSDNLFTRYTVQHPRNWQLYIQSNRVTMPYELNKVLGILGINAVAIEEEVAWWLKNR